MTTCCVDISDIGEGCNVESTSEESEQVASDYTSRITEVLTHDRVLVFTDGSVYSPGSAGLVGCGACAAVVFSRVKEIMSLRLKHMQLVQGRVVNSARLKGYYWAWRWLYSISERMEINIEGVTESIYIFCDCQRVIDIFVKQGWLSGHPGILERVLGICEQLKDISCVVKLVWVMWV